MASSSNGSSVVLKIVAVVLVIVALFIGYRAMFAGGPTDDFRMVCIATGETYWMSRDELVQLPAQNPDTGQRTLLPCVERDGELYVSSRYGDALRSGSIKELNQYVDTETLRVRAPR